MFMQKTIFCFESKLQECMFAHFLYIYFFDQQRAEKRVAPHVLLLETCHTDHDITDRD